MDSASLPCYLPSQQALPIVEWTATTFLIFQQKAKAGFQQITSIFAGTTFYSQSVSQNLSVAQN